MMNSYKVGIFLLRKWYVNVSCSKYTLKTVPHIQCMRSHDYHVTLTYTCTRKAHIDLCNVADYVVQFFSKRISLPQIGLLVKCPYFAQDIRELKVGERMGSTRSVPDNTASCICLPTQGTPITTRQKDCNQMDLLVCGQTQ